MRDKHILLALEATSGGAAKHVLLLAEMLLSEGSQVDLLVSLHRSSPLFLKQLDRLKEKGLRPLYLSLSYKISVFKDSIAILKIRQRLASQSYDLVHAHSSKAGFLVRLAAIGLNSPPIIYTPHCFYFHSKTGLSKLFFLGLEKMAGLVTSRMVLVSNAEFASAARHKIGWKKDRLLIKNGLPILQPNPNRGQRLRSTFPIGNRILIVGIGRISQQKNWIFFIRCCAQLARQRTDLHFALIGSGAELPACQRLITELDLSDRFFTLQPKGELTPYFETADVVVNVSLWEGLPYSILEGMQAKKPIVASDIGGNNELIRHQKNGLLYPSNDQSAFIDRVLDLCDSPEKRLEMGQQSAAILAAEYALDQFLEQHKTMYLQLMDRVQIPAQTEPLDTKLFSVLLTKNQSPENTP